MRYLLDTSFLIDYLRGDATTVARLSEMFDGGDLLLINEIVVCELAAGIRPHHKQAMAALLEPLEFVQPGPEAALSAGRWRSEARGAGSILSLADALIADAADALDAAVLTRNARDFALTPARFEAY